MLSHSEKCEKTNYRKFEYNEKPFQLHCVKSVQIQSYFWSVFSLIRTKNNFIFGHFSCSAGYTIK